MPKDPLRQAAILITALDRRSADALMDQMPPDQAARIRQAVMELDGVSDAEQQRVIQQFMRPPSFGGPSATEGVELTLSRRDPDTAATDSSPPLPRPTAPDAPPNSLPHLRQADTHQLVTLLGYEHPQTIAVFTAQLPPDRASELLDRLPDSLQTDVLRRVAMLGETDPQIVREIEEAIDNRLSQENLARPAGPTGIGALRAMMAASDPHRRERLLARLAHHDPQLVQQLGLESESTEPSPMVGAARRPQVVAPSGHNPSDPPGGEGPESPRAAGCPSAPHHPHDEDRRPARDASIELAFADLAELDDRGWATVLSQVATDVAMIALAGASDQLVQRVLRLLPSRQAQNLQRQMCQLGPIRLGDVEQAQRQLARLACQLCQQGTIQVPARRRNLAAAA
jgi:flagellar motor switch protein FliG